jgi:hypothetical protein
VTAGAARPVYLFSYGTLQQDEVQQNVFGRCCATTPDILPGFRRVMIRVSDEAFAASSGSAWHAIACASDDPADEITGAALEISESELSISDAYEVAEYTRVPVTLRSGRSAWVYAESPAA